MFNTTGGLDGMGQCQTQWVNSAEIATNLNSPRVPWRQCLPTLTVIGMVTSTLLLPAEITMLSLIGGISKCGDEVGERRQRR
jgi:hypothetical protein